MNNWINTAKKSLNLVPLLISMGIGTCMSQIVFNHQIYASAINNPLIQEYTRIDKKTESLPKKPSPVDLLAISLETTHGHLRYKETSEIDIERTLKTQEGCCKEFSIITYSNYLYLAKKLNPGLIDKVRLSKGGEFIKDDKNKLGFDYTGHVWLEVNLNGHWTTYETTGIGGLRENVPCRRDSTLQIDSNGKTRQSLEPNFLLFGLNRILTLAPAIALKISEKE